MDLFSLKRCCTQEQLNKRLNPAYPADGFIIFPGQSGSTYLTGINYTRTNPAMGAGRAEKIPET